MRGRQIIWLLLRATNSLDKILCLLSSFDDWRQGLKESLTLVAFFQAASRRGGMECRDGGQGIARWQNTTRASPDGGEEGHCDDESR